MNEQTPLEETSNKNIASMIEKKENPPEIKDAIFLLDVSSSVFCSFIILRYILILYIFIYFFQFYIYPHIK